MTEKLEFYKCNICENLIQVVLDGAGELVCCGEPMEKLIPHHNDNDVLSEKHVPQFEKREDKNVITLKYHPMTSEHYIQFIEVYKKDKSRFCLKYLNPNEPAEFDLHCTEEDVGAFEHCNIHGLWENKND